MRLFLDSVAGSGKVTAMRTRTLTDEERALIVRMREGGVKSSDIASLLSMPRSTVSTILTKWRTTGCLKTKKPKPRPSKLSKRALRDLGRLIHGDRHLTLAALAATFGVCRTTIRAYIRKLGFCNRVAARKPFLSVSHRMQRLQFARAYRHWMAEDWKHVIWTDESSFELGKNSRQIRVWRKTHEKYAMHCLAPTFKSGRTSVMVWGAFTGFEKSPLVFLPQGERTAADFVQNVYEGILSGFYFMHVHRNELVLMEDGAPVHRARVSQLWREAHGIRKLKWPPNSPDLNPIENLWKILKDLLRNHKKPSNKQEMIEVIERVWSEVTLEQLETLVCSMPSWMEAVIATHGGSTRW